jgi:hypothetical protein
MITLITLLRWMLRRKGPKLVTRRPRRKTRRPAVHASRIFRHAVPFAPDLEIKTQPPVARCAGPLTTRNIILN